MSKNSEYLEKIKDENVDYKVLKEFGEHEIEYRKMRALEIIAEQIINLDNTLACLNTTLENIETAFKQR